MSSSSMIIGNPYIGPRAFQDGEKLYGRQRETDQLVNLIIAERIILLHSPSGAGKTSLIQAALYPRLAKMKFHVLPLVRVNLDTPNASTGNGRYNRYVLSALLSLEENLPAEKRKTVDELAKMRISDYLAQRDKPENGRGIEVLIFDQFEEVLTLDPTDQHTKMEFFNQLGEALHETRRWALFSMRDEYVAALNPYLLPIPNRFQNTFRLDMLEKAAAIQAIQEPARQAGVIFEDAAAEKLVDDLRRVQVQRPDGKLEMQLGSYVEPVQLQVVCYRLWDAPRPEHEQITDQDLAAFGQVNQSLVDQYLSEFYAQSVTITASKTGASERFIREWFDRQLITQHGVRGTVLMGPGQSGELDNRAIWSLVDDHLVRAEKRRGTTWFELSHDRLILPIRTDNDVWFKTNLSLLQRQADLWNQQGRPEGLLFRDKELADARVWAESQETDLLPAEADFLTACQEIETRALRLKRRNQAIYLLGLVAAILIILTALAISSARRNQTELQYQIITTRSETLASQSQALIDNLSQKSLLLAIEALNITENAHVRRRASAEEALRATLKNSLGLPLASHEDGVNILAFSPDGRWLASGSEDQTILMRDMHIDLDADPIILSGHQGRVNTLGFSPDGGWLASGGKDGRVRLWDLGSANPALKPLILSGHDDEILTLAFSPDGHRLATGSIDGTTRLWNLNTGQLGIDSRVLPHPQGWVQSMDFSPDGRWLATGGSGGTTLVWDLSLADPVEDPLILAGHDKIVQDLAFSPDGRWLATASRDGTARLWDLERSNMADYVIVLEGHEDWVNTLAFSPDGRYLATGSGDETTRLWNIKSPNPAEYSVLLQGHDAPINMLAFSPDGRWLATGNQDGTTQLWDAKVFNTAVDPELLCGHDASVTTLAFSPDGHWLATGSGEGSVNLFDTLISSRAVNPLILSRHEGSIKTLAFNAAGTQLATGSGDPNALVWNLLSPHPGENPEKLSGHTTWIDVLAFSPDGRWLATGSGDHSARLWDLNDSDPSADPIILSDHEQKVEALAISPQGRWFATGSGENIRLWQLGEATNRLAPPILLAGHDGEVLSLLISPDGHWLASGSADKTIRLWDLESSNPAERVVVLSGHKDIVFSLAISPDGRWLASSGGDGDKTVRLWDLSAENPADGSVILSGHEGPIGALAFSPDGRWLSSGSWDSTARLWDLKVADPTTSHIILRGHTGWVNALDFSKTDTGGLWLASGSSDGTIRLWDVESDNPEANSVVLRDHSDGVTTLAFSPDGHWLATGSDDQTVRLWLVQIGDLIKLACQSAGRNFTQDEWDQFFPDEEYRRTCDLWPAGQ